MQIYIKSNIRFTIVDTKDDIDWDKDNARMAKLPMQDKWEAYEAQFQVCDPNASSTAKWQLKEKIFELEK